MFSLTVGVSFLLFLANCSDSAFAALFFSRRSFLALSAACLRSSLIICVVGSKSSSLSGASSDSSSSSSSESDSDEDSIVGSCCFWVYIRYRMRENQTA